MKIALIGKMFSGKTTSANCLVENYNYRQMAFAEPVKRISATLLNYMSLALRHDFGADLEPYSWTYEEIQKRKGEPQVRALLQLVGTELGRELVGYSDIWVDLLIQEVDPLSRVVVDDCRFPNEAEALRENGFTLIRLTRPEKDRMSLVKERYPDTWRQVVKHPSETALDDFPADVTIRATTAEDLMQKIATYVEQENAQ